MVTAPRANAYRRGARVHRVCPDKDVHSAGKTGNSGIGPVLADKMMSGYSTASSIWKLCVRPCRSVVEMTNIAGVGTKLARKIL